MKYLIALLFLLFFSGCVSTAPISVAWRSNSNMQTASTDGQTTNKEESPAVNADKTTETQSAVATSSGGANTNDNRKSEPVAEDSKKDTVEDSEASTDAVNETTSDSDK